MAARLQTLARPGQVLVNKRAAMVSKFHWYQLIDITSAINDKLKQIKGISTNELEVFDIKHKYFHDDWDAFCL